MRRLYALVVSFFCLTSLFGQVIIENSIADLGVIVESKGEVKTTFYIRGGQDTSYIESVETSCGCTTIISKDKTILPQKRLELIVTYDPKGRMGYFSKAVQVKVNTNGIDQWLNMIVKGRVIRASNELSKNNLRIHKINVKPIQNDFLNEFDTTSFDQPDLINFFNTISYIIDKDNFVTLQLDLKIKDSFFINKSNVWLKKYKSRIKNGLKNRGYQDYQINYNPLRISVDKNQFFMGEISSSVPNYQDSSLSENSIEYKSENKIDNSIINCEFESNEGFKKFALQLDTWLDSKLFLLDSVSDVVFRGVFTNKKWKKKASKLLKAKRKKYKDEFVFSDSLRLGADFSFSLDHLVSAPNFSFVKMNHAFDWEKRTPTLSTCSMEVNEDKSTNKNYQFMLEQIENSADSVDIFVQLKSPYFNKKPNLVKLRKKLYQIEADLKGSWKEKGLKIKSIHVELLTYKKKNKVDLIDELLIIPFQRKQEKIRLVPYQVQFNSNQFQLDSNSYVLKKFIKTLVDDINLNGYSSVIIESSSSYAPTRTDLSSIEMSYVRRNESEKFLKRKINEYGVDPNRLVVASKKAFLDGPHYKNDYFQNKRKYNIYQYLKLIPSKTIIKN